MSVYYEAPQKLDKERVQYWVDMSSELTPGETLVAPEDVYADVVLGQDPSPDDIVEDLSLVRTSVGIRVARGVPGCLYNVYANVSTSLGRTITAIVIVAVEFAPPVTTVSFPIPDTEPVYQHTVQTVVSGANHLILLGRYTSVIPEEIPAADGTIDWGDGTPPQAVNTNTVAILEHVYAAPGTYQVTFTGSLIGIEVPNNPGNNAFVLSVDRFGTGGLRIATYTAQHNLTIVPSWLPPSFISLGGPIQGIFNRCTNFNSLAVTFWDVSNITNMYGAFSNCPTFNQNLNNWDVSSVENFQSMFENSISYNSPMDRWDVSSATVMVGMFANCINFNQPLSSWDVSSVTNMSSMFNGCTRYNQPMNTWDVGSVTNFNSMFAGCVVFNQDLNNWNTSSAIDMRSMFLRAVEFNGDVSTWDTSNVRFMTRMFADDLNFYDGADRPMRFNRDIGSWDVGAVEDFSQMFQGCQQFNQDLSSWRPASATLMIAMFLRAISFNSDVSGWRVPLCTSFSQMFSGRFANIDDVDPYFMSFSGDVSAWGVSSACTSIDEMFLGCSSFNSDLSAWDVSNVERMQQVFGWCFSFNGSLANWDTSSVTITAGMFVNAIVFDQDISHFAMDNVTDMRRMFMGAWKFNSNISNWNTGQVTAMDDMFYGAQEFNQDLSSWCVSNIPTKPPRFDEGAVNWEAPRPIWGTCPS